MSTELTPFAEVTQPAQTLPDGRGDEVAPGQTLGRLDAVVEWFDARLAVPGTVSRPRWVLVAGDVEGPDTGLDDAIRTAGLAEALEIGGRRVDVASASASDGDSVAGEFSIVRGQRSPVGDDVLTREQAIDAIDAGRRLADQEIDAGADLLIPGLAGRGHTVSLGVLTSVFTGLEPVEAVPLGDTDLPMWSAAVCDLRDALFRIRDRDKDVIALLVAVGGADVGALAGMIAQAAARRTPVLLDGLPATIAALLAHRLAPGAEAWFIAAGEATTRGGRRLQEMLGLRTVASLGTNSPAGAGALLVLPLIRAALGARRPSRPTLSQQPASG